MALQQGQRVTSSRVRVIPAKTRTARNEENNDGQKKRMSLCTCIHRLSYAGNQL